jgi:hypothetical protein
MKTSPARCPSCGRTIATRVTRRGRVWWPHNKVNKGTAESGYGPASRCPRSGKVINGTD